MTITPRLRMIFAVAIGIGLIAAAIWAIGAARTEASAEADRERPVATPQRVFTDDGQTVLRLDAATLARSGIVTGRLAASDGATTVPVFATVVDTARLTDLANAWAVGAAQVSAARARASASKASLVRTRLLYADAQNASLAQLQAAQATYAADQAGANAAQVQAATALASARQEFGPALTPGSALVDAIVSRRSLLLQVALPPGAGAPPPTMLVEGDGGVRASARLIGAAARVDPRVPGRGAYYILPGSSGLVPGMSVTAQFATGSRAQGTTVPASAIVSWQGRNWIYRRRPDGAFVRVPVSTEQRDPAGSYVVHDVPPGTPAAIRGAQLLLSEELKSQTPTESDGD
ncbi:hypothetical protein [Sphingomonas psychrolutea]|uniref:Multidrug efflux pump subunit AcrA (Membrane-fusion protein) n=1 Tax=Sphingomonas psychrolutea TaxID=1259676 RepID=A0ABQ1H4X5_9SPHN|nr:hypothetical protein [Sphingomonas psychrolutea]GGA58882.1 hypothetical protein GCM10011395_31450 [Sphingomonas psychrolutea]